MSPKLYFHCGGISFVILLNCSNLAPQLDKCDRWLQTFIQGEILLNSAIQKLKIQSRDALKRGKRLSGELALF